MVAEHASRSIDVRNLLRIQQVIPRLQSVALAPAPRHIAARGEVVSNLYFEGPVDAHLIAPLEREKIQHRRRAELAGIGLEMGSLVIGGQLQGRPFVEGVVTAHLKIVRALRPGIKSGRILRLRSGSLEIHFGERDLLNIRRREQSAIVGMKHVRPIQLIGEADAWAHLPFIVEALNDVPPHAEVHSQCIRRAPLVLDPEFFARLYVGIGTGLREHRSHGKASPGVDSEVKQLKLILRVRVLELKPGFHEMLSVGNPRMIEPRAECVCLPLLICCLRVIGQRVERIGGKVRIGIPKIAGQLKEVLSIHVMAPDEVGVLRILLLVLVNRLRSHWENVGSCA